MITTRFAPSPTGYMHIGSLRTALFNWLFAKHHNGQFLLRIEDTDKLRSNKETIDIIIECLKWMELDWDGEIVYQSDRAKRHAAIAHQLVDEDKAYFCYCTQEEVETMRQEAYAQKRPMRYNGYWRDRKTSPPPGVKPVVRLKTPESGTTILNDIVQNTIKIDNKELDDMVLLRNDGSPTYMLSVVADDHDMDITHVIRGDDHLTNTFRQMQLYTAMGWDMPFFAHVPLIHGPDGQKLSKRNGSVSVEHYIDMGIVPKAFRNYLIRLGWSHGNDEIISDQQAEEWFDLDHVGQSPSKFDINKLLKLNMHYIHSASTQELFDMCKPFWRKNHDIDETIIEQEDIKQRLFMGMDGLKVRAKTIKDLASSAIFYIKTPALPEKIDKMLTSIAVKILSDFSDPWILQNVENTFKESASSHNLDIRKFAETVRLLLTGSKISPSIFEIIYILGRNECIRRLQRE